MTSTMIYQFMHCSAHSSKYWNTSAFHFHRMSLEYMSSNRIMLRSAPSSWKGAPGETLIRRWTNAESVSFTQTSAEIVGHPNRSISPTIISVSIAPGSTDNTSTFLSFNSACITIESIDMYALLALYVAIYDIPSFASELKNMIPPFFRRTNLRANWRARDVADTTLTASNEWWSSSVWCKNDPCNSEPALFTSNPTSKSSQLCTTWRQPYRVDKSATITRVLTTCVPLTLSAISCKSISRRATSTTFMPFSASCLTNCFPTPPDAPVTTAHAPYLVVNDSEHVNVLLSQCPSDLVVSDDAFVNVHSVQVIHSNMIIDTVDVMWVALLSFIFAVQRRRRFSVCRPNHRKNTWFSVASYVDTVVWSITH